MDYKNSSDIEILSGLTVIELGHYVASPFCTRMMGLLGADVIKIEKPGDGDPTRKMGPFPENIPHLEKSGLFLSLNTNKKSITLNLNTSEGIDILKTLIQDADIVIENFRPSVMSSWGLAFDVLEKIKSDLILISITNFGQNGPYRNYKANELTLWAMSGLMNIHGDQEKPPLHIGGHIVSYIGGYAGFLAAMAALHHKELTGEGQHGDVSILENLIFCHPQTLTEYTYLKKSSTFCARGPSVVSPIYLSLDGRLIWVTLVANKWANFTQLLGKPDIEKDPRFAKEEDRAGHLLELEDIVFPFIVSHESNQLVEMAKKEGVLLSVQRNIDEVLTSDHYKARTFFQKANHPLAGPLNYPTLPYKIGDFEPDVNAAPKLGQHNEEVFSGRLGLSKEDLARLNREGVI